MAAVGSSEGAKGALRGNSCIAGGSQGSGRCSRCCGTTSDGLLRLSSRWDGEAWHDGVNGSENR